MIFVKELYPVVRDEESTFVEASGIIGYADTLLEALTQDSLKAITDSQYYFSKLFTNADLRVRLAI